MSLKFPNQETPSETTPAITNTIHSNSNSSNKLEGSEEENPMAAMIERGHTIRAFQQNEINFLEESEMWNHHPETDEITSESREEDNLARLLGKTILAELKQQSPDQWAYAVEREAVLRMSPQDSRLYKLNRPIDLALAPALPYH